MCKFCYDSEFDSPKIKNELTLKAAKLIRKMYNTAFVHIVIDDWNLEDGDIKWCIGEIEKNENNYLDKDQQEIQKECMELFLMMTPDERASTLAIEEEWI